MAHMKVDMQGFKNSLQVLLPHIQDFKCYLKKSCVTALF